MRIGYEAKRVFHNASGLGNYSRNLIRSMVEFYPQNDYFLYNPFPAKIPFGKEYNNIHEILPDYSNPILANLWRQKLIPKQAEKDKIDIFHGLSHELPSGLKKRGIPSVVTVHDLIFIRKPELYKAVDRKIYSLKVKAACEQASHIVAASKQTQSDLVELLKIPMERTSVIYQGCNPLYWQEPSESELNLVKKKYNLPDEYTLFVGTLEKRKNVIKLAEAAKKLKTPLVLIGRKTTYWEQYLSREGRLNPYLINPKVDDNHDLACIYSMANLFVYPSHFEGFGIPVLEALVRKTPVITSKTSSLPEVAGPDSMLINPDSDSELVNSMEIVLTSKSLQAKMKQNGYNFAQQFKDENLAAQWQKLYQSIL